MSISTWVAYSGVSSISRSDGVPRGRGAEVRQHSVGVELLGLREEARLGPEPHDRVGVALDHRARDLDLELDRARRHALEQPEVEERHPTVVEQHRVARVRVARELAVAVQAAEVEAEQDLADPVALLVRKRLELLEAGPVNVLGDHHPLAARAR